MAVKKVPLYQSTSDKIYVDEYGFIGKQFDCSITGAIKVNDVRREERASISNTYIKKKDEKTGSDFSRLTVCDLLNVFDLELYFERATRYRGYYGSGDPIKEEDLIKVEKILGVSVSALRQNIVAKPNKKEELIALLEKEVYDLPFDYKKDHLFDYEIKEGMRVYYSNKTWEVLTVYSQPNIKGELCKIKNLTTGKEEIVDCSLYNSYGQLSSARLEKVPYEKYPARKNELDIFNKEVRECDLQPYWEQDQQKGNLYWQGIEEAMLYNVYVYKYRKNDALAKKLYLLEKIEVERNKHWITIDELIGKNYVVRIEAENRQGEQIAISRGIPINFEGKTNGILHYWK